MATCSSIPAWEIPRAEEPGGLQPMWSHRVGAHNKSKRWHKRDTERVRAERKPTTELPWWLGWQSVCLQCGQPGFDPWLGKIPWRRKCQPTPVVLPGESHGQRSLVGYSPWGRKESDTTEHEHAWWVIVDLNCVSFKCITKWLSYTFVCVCVCIYIYILI